MQVIHIGRCKGCNNVARLDEGACRACLGDGTRGRKWVEMAHRCRTEPEFALNVYRRIKSSDKRAAFVEMFGLPPGADEPEREAQSAK